LPYECDGDDNERRWRAGASAGGFRTTIDFGDQKVDIEQVTASAALGWQRSPRWGLVLSVGGILGGSVATDAERDVGTGFMGSVTGTWLPVFETDRRPFLLASLTFGGAITTAESDDAMSRRWSALDLRAGLMVGKTLADRFVPFAAVRGFVGPVSWRLGGQDVTGTDVHKYSVGAGVTLRIPGVLDVFGEILPLGEQSASVGGTVAF